MLHTIQSASTWATAEKLVLERFGKKIKMKWINLDPYNKTSFIKNDDLIIPLCSETISELNSQKMNNQIFNSESTVLAEVTIEKGKYLSPEQAFDAEEVLKLLLEPTMNRIFQANIKANQNQFSRHLSIEKAASYDLNQDNVFIFDSRNSAFENNSAFDDEEEIIDLNNTSDEDLEIKMISPAVYVASLNEFKRKQVALKIHELSQSHFFLTIEDLELSINSVQDLADLGSLTIFIDNLQHISEKSLQIINLFDSENMPELKLVFAGTLAVHQIEMLNLNQNIKSLLKTFHLDVDRIPIDQHNLKDVVELLFFDVDHESNS